MQYRTKTGDMVDSICYRYYGRADAVEQVLEANPGLAQLGPVIPPGTLIELPDLQTPTSNAIVLWE